MTDRNAPCPCGSSKKYKKCCGTAAESHKTPPDRLEVNRKVAYLGEIGRRREAFCEAYSSAKKITLAGIAGRLTSEAAATGKAISCGRGCSHCCKMFVVASLQECEAIVHHLYHHEPALRLFLRNFPRWNERILKIESAFRRVNALHARITAGEASASEEKQFESDCEAYARADIPCPFLENNACAVYEARPYVCARIVAVTPPEWCRAGHPRQGEALHLKAQIDFENDMPYFAPALNACTFSSMPFMVFSLLHEGYEALSSIPGLEGLKDEAHADPAMRQALQDNGGNA